MSGQEAGVTVPQTDAELLKQIQQAYDANVNPEAEFRVSRVAIAQPGTPEISEQRPGYKSGMLLDSITREPLTDFIKAPWLLERGVKEEECPQMHCGLIVPVFKLPSEYIKWYKRDERQPGGDRWEFKTLDKNDPRVKAGVWKSLGGTFGTDPKDKGKAPPVTDNCNYLCLFIDPKTGMPKTNFLVQTFARTSAEAGKQLTTAIGTNKMQGLLPWDRCFWLYTELKPFQKQGDPKPTYANVIHVTRGPLSRDIVKPATLQEILTMARALSAPNTGMILQTAFINAADLEASDESDDAPHGAGGQTVEEDPFQTPPESKDEFPQ